MSELFYENNKLLEIRKLLKFLEKILCKFQENNTKYKINFIVPLNDNSNKTIELSQLLSLNDDDNEKIISTYEIIIQKYSSTRFTKLMNKDVKNNNSEIVNEFRRYIIKSDIIHTREIPLFDILKMIIFALYVILCCNDSDISQNNEVEISESESESKSLLDIKNAYYEYFKTEFNSGNDKINSTKISYGYYIHRFIYFILCNRFFSNYDSDCLICDIQEIVELFSEENKYSVELVFQFFEQKFEEIQITRNITICIDNKRIPFVIFKKETEFFILDLANSEDKFIIEHTSKNRLILNKLVIGASNIITWHNKVYQFVF